MPVQRVLGIGAGGVISQYFLIIRELSNVFHRITQSVINRLIRPHRKHYVRSPACHHRCQQGIRPDNFYIDFNACLRSKGIVHHGLQDCTLITSCKNPHLNHIAAFLIHITHRIIIHDERGRKGTHLMNYLLKEISSIFLRLGLRAADHNIVNIQLRLAHI